MKNILETQQHDNIKYAIERGTLYLYAKKNKKILFKFDLDGFDWDNSNIKSELLTDIENALDNLGIQNEFKEEILIKTTEYWGFPAHSLIKSDEKVVSLIENYTPGSKEEINNIARESIKLLQKQYVTNVDFWMGLSAKDIALISPKTFKTLLEEFDNSNFRREADQLQTKLDLELEQPKTLDRQTYLYVPYEEKEAAKSVGIQWDNEHKSWYAPKGTEIKKIREWLPNEQEMKVGIKSVATMNSDPILAFQGELEKRGFEINGSPIADGRIHRVHIAGHSVGTKNGAYVINQDGRPHLWLKDWTGIVENISHKENYYKAGASDREIDAQKEINRIKAVQNAKDRDRMHYAVSKRVTREYRDLVHSNIPCPYAAAKRVQVWNAKVKEDGTLVIPFINTKDETRTVQKIPPQSQDGRWAKYWEKHGEKEGNFALIGASDFTSYKERAKAIILVEGYATGVSVETSLKDTPVVVVGDSGNFAAVAKNILKEIDRDIPIIIAADNDILVKKPIENPGLTKAKEAAEAVESEFGKKVIVVKPIFTQEEVAKGMSDWNDLLVSRSQKDITTIEGRHAIKRQIQSQYKSQTPQAENTNKKEFDKAQEVIKRKQEQRSLGL